MSDGRDENMVDSNPVKEYKPPGLEQFFAAVPSASAIDSARKDVMTVILEEFPMSGGRVIVRASDVAERLRTRGHTLASSLFAVRKCVDAQELFALSTNPPEDENWSLWNNVNLFVSSQWPSNSSTKSLQSGLWGLTVDASERKVWRQGYAENLEFGGKQLPWFIFKTVFDAKGGDIDMSSFKRAYEDKGSWDARYTAVNSLNKQLRKLGLKVTQWKLHEL